jgi:hypothetical protein
MGAHGYLPIWFKNFLKKQTKNFLNQNLFKIKNNQKNGIVTHWSDKYKYKI